MEGYTITMQCPHCHEFVSVQPDDCERCGQPLLPQPTGVGVCERCGGPTGTFDGDADGAYPVICRDCIRAIVNGAEW